MVELVAAPSLGNGSCAYYYLIVIFFIYDIYQWCSVYLAL